MMAIVNGVLTLVLLILFIGIWAWAWSSHNREKFDEMAHLPLQNSDSGREVQNDE